MTDMRKAARAAYLEAYAKVPTIAAMLPDGTPNAHWAGLDAVISLMRPEIDRRVAEERAKLLERLREPGWGLVETVMGCGPIGCCIIGETEAKAILVSIAEAIAQFEKENSYEN